MDIDGTEIDLDDVTDRTSFCKGVLWMAQTVHAINDNIEREMHAFDGIELTEGIRMAITKQNEGLVGVERFMKAYLDATR